jgi:hypothetical protein
LQLNHKARYEEKTSTQTRREEKGGRQGGREEERSEKHKGGVKDAKRLSSLKKEDQRQK